MSMLETTKQVEVRLLSALKPHPKHRIFFDLDELQLNELAEDIRVNGLREPPEICSDGTIICGHQRVRAVRLLGWSEISCWVRRDLEEEGREAVEKRLIEDNFNRRQLSDLETAKAYKLLKEFKYRPGQGDLRDVLGKRFNMSGRSLDRLLQILRTPHEVQQAYVRRQITAGLAGKISRLSKPQKGEIANRIARGENPKQVALEFVGPATQTPAPGRSLTRLANAVKRNLDDLRGQEKSLKGADFNKELEILRAASPAIRHLIQHLEKGAESIRNPNR